VPDVKTFIDWLSFHPSIDEIVKALTTDYLVGFGIDKIYFSEVSIDKSAHNLDFIPSTQEKWSPSSQTFVYIMRDHGLIHKMQQMLLQHCLLRLQHWLHPSRHRSLH